MRYPGIPHPGGERSAMKRIDILPSKSAAHRMLIAAALCEEPCDVILSERSLDIEATENCLAEIRRMRKEGAMPEGNGDAAEEAQLHCGESGSTLRFLLPVAGALGAEGRFLREGRLPDRPLWQRALLGAGLITGVEFLSGCVLNLWLRWAVWDYSRLPGNLLGQVCPLFCFLWFLLSLPVLLLCGWLRHHMEPDLPRQGGLCWR